MKLHRPERGKRSKIRIVYRQSPLLLTRENSSLSFSPFLKLNTMDSPVLIIDDNNDDEFDWEAAVQEIDDACQKTREPASFSSSLPPPIHAQLARAEKRGISNESCSQLNGLHKKNRQSTLDQFVNRASNPNLNRDIDKGKESELEAEIEVDAKGCCVSIDPEAAKTWIYPENVPLREYQLSISKKALFSNTMVALPTGLGKTLIAAVVMYNYFRWFPEGKIVFTAPSRPLVIQQIEACHNIVGIPQEWTIDMTGQTSPAKRACLWKEKRVFFVTPQVFEKDIKSGTCLVQYLVCLVIDEAHRATGNYSYCVAVRELMDAPVQLRILALTATPGSKQQAIQQVIDKLQISTLEYRNESDPDVAPYVHNRKLDLIEVPLGQDAVDVSNLLLDVIRPMAARLFSMGVLPNRDFQMLSPCDLLTSREKFRQAPPSNLPPKKFGEVEGCFRALLSLYHVRKLLSSHGIRPAYEMLEDKFKQGPMSKNECIHQLKVAMRRSMSNGAPSPKLSKLIEVLVDHFKNNDPESSRVIIFSNFRGSVRDIMDALSNLGNIVRPTEFIGQSSGKTLKGQTQKVQQAVLEKFRKGGYNVIVATCIAEEGLDIMEVDLVICFDANISPLRMTQRMGRTGRKHDGRVVIIVCEGSEMKGYIRKQATSKAVRKHMRNGGMNSFIFHPSPRMVPHIYRPEQKCLQLSIPEFVHRGKEVKDDAVLLLHFEKKLTEAEALTLARYFSNKDNTWKPSLIAYPHFQGFPSRVQMVKHSSRTIMLIDTMQRMQGQSCTWNSPSCDVEFQNYPDHSAEVRSFDKVDKTEEEYVEASNAELFLCTANTEMHSILNSPEKALGTTKPASDTSFGKDLYVEAAPVGEVLNAMALHDISGSKRLPVSDVTSPCHHLFLFSSQVASIDSIGRVLVAPIPILDVKEILHSLNPIARNSILPHCSGHAAAADSEAVYGDAKELLKETTFFASLSSPVETKCEHLEAMRRSQSPTPKINPVQKIRPGDFLHETANAMIYSSQQDFSNDDDEGEFDLSPRLVNFVKSGCVPESPIHGYTAGAIDDIEIIDMEPKVLVTSYAKDEGVVVISNPCTPVPKAAKSSINAEDYCEGVMEFRTPLANLTNSTCSKDWYMSSGEKPVGDKRNSNFKRLRKIGDTKSCNEMKENPGKFTNIECIVPVRRRPDNGGLERVLDVRDLIQEEAEVSSEVEVSTDEEDDQNDNTFEDSFINDKVDSTMATQLQSTEVDMMAIYRRSLLSQSPIRRQKKHSSPVTPDSLASVTSLNSCYETQNSLPTTPQTSTMHNSSSSRRISVCSRLEKIAEEAMPSTSGKIKNDKTSPQSSRKRKYSCGEHTVPAINLGNEFSSMHYPPKGPSLQGIGANPNDADWNFDMDDEFYESLDFDALEAQAAKLLEEKAAVSSSRKESVSEPIQPRVDNLGIPSFDLGIL